MAKLCWESKDNQFIYIEIGTFGLEQCEVHSQSLLMVSILGIGFVGLLSQKEKEKSN
jgi:hypothetical protein